VISLAQKQVAKSERVAVKTAQIPEKSGIFQNFAIPEFRIAETATDRLRVDTLNIRV
jgi:hypothetical protein